jgi:hypothetical protein
MKERPLSLISSAFLSGCFLLILVLPVAQNLLHFAPEVALPEQRRLRNYPPLRWQWKALSSFPARFEAAFNDRFGGRGLLVRAQALAKFYWLQISPSPKVMMGRGGWFYLNNSITEYRGLAPLPAGRIRKWKKEFSQKQAYLKARGIRYLVVVVPNKEVIYPEFLPENVIQIRHRLYIDDLRKALPAEVRSHILDLRQTLLEAKKVGRLYLQTDSHWNQLGAAVGSDAVIARLSTWFPELRGEKDRGPFRIVNGKSGDLARLMGIEDHLREEAIVVPKKQRVRPAALLPGLRKKGLEHNAALVAIGGNQKRTAVVDGDSFSSALNLFLPAHFRRTLTIRPLLSFDDPFFKRVIEAEKPDVYIEVIVERNLASPPRAIDANKRRPGAD